MARLTISEYAKRKKLSRQYLYNLIYSGVLAEAIEKTAGILKIDEKKADKALALHIEKKSVSDRDSSLTAERVRTQSLRARLLEQELQKKTGKLIDVEQVRAAAMETGQMVRDSLLQIPDRISAICAAETDEHKVRLILDEEIRSSLERLADSISGA
jgi:hypothetical protein